MTGSMAGETTYRRLAFEDLPLVTGWLNTSHVRILFQRAPISADAVTAKYGIRRGPPTAHWPCSMGRRLAICNATAWSIGRTIGR